MSGSIGHQSPSVQPAFTAISPARCCGMTLATSAFTFLPALVTISLVLGSRLTTAIVVDLGRQVQLDDVLVVLVEGLGEHGLLGEGLLGIEDDELRLGLLGLEVVGDHARPLVGAGRAAVGIAGHHHRHRAAVAHGNQLVPDLALARSRRRVAVRHDAGGLARVAFDGVVLDVDARRQHEPVVGVGAAAARLHGLLGGVDVGGEVVHHLDAQPPQPAVAVVERFQRAEAADVEVGEERGAVDRVGLDQRDVELGRPLLDVVGHRRTAGAAAHDHHLGRALGDGEWRPGRRRPRADTRHAGQPSKIAPGNFRHPCLPVPFASSTAAASQPRCELQPLILRCQGLLAMRGAGAPRVATAFCLCGLEVCRMHLI